MEAANSENDSVTVISNRNFEAQILGTHRPVLLLCMPNWQTCSAQVDVLRAVSDAYGDLIRVCRLGEDFIKGFKQMYNIKGMPVFLLLERGKEKNRMLGMADREHLEVFLNQNLKFLKD